MSINNITLTFFPIGLEYLKNYFISAIGAEYDVCYIDYYKESISNYYIQQYNAPQIKFLLFAPQSNPHTTIMFANIMDGYTSLIKYVSRIYNNMEYYTISISDGTSQMMNAYHFQYYAQSKQRHILCYQDPQWVFFEDGEPLWFEDVTHYKQRLKKNRLNKSIILEYLKSLGWEIDKEDFWLPSTGFYEFSKQGCATRHTI